MCLAIVCDLFCGMVVRDPLVAPTRGHKDLESS